MNIPQPPVTDCPAYAVRGKLQGTRTWETVGYASLDKFLVEGCLKLDLRHNITKDMEIYLVPVTPETLSTYPIHP
jgi:hypothetical protein